MGQLQRFVAVVTIIAVACAPWPALAQLSPAFYAGSCPNLQAVVNQAFLNAMAADQRIGASLLRMHFHDCFAQGCDASVLLANTATFTGEQSSPPNLLLRGFGVVDTIKAAVEAACPGIVSCADILALIARDAVVQYGGPGWPVDFGRRDSLTACPSCTGDIPAPTDTGPQLAAAFSKKGLSQTDLVALSGSHTVGKSHCSSFSNRLSPPDPTINPLYLGQLEQECPSGSGNIVDLDPTTPFIFDDNYYTNLGNGFGLLTSDEALESGPTVGTVAQFAAPGSFFGQYAASIISMGRISPLTGTAGEIRAVCSTVNGS